MHILWYIICNLEAKSIHDNIVVLLYNCILRFTVQNICKNIFCETNIFLSRKETAVLLKGNNFENVVYKS